jgi:hypothetical protein
MVLFLIPEVCSCVSLLIYFGHHLSEVQNDHGDTTSLGSVHCISCCGGHTSSLLTGLSSYAKENAEQRIWVEERLPFLQSQKKYFKLLSENMTYPQSAGSCRMSTQMENPIIEI